MKNLDLKNNTEENEKNIIERTEEAREIAKKLKDLYEHSMLFTYLHMRHILDFLTLPYIARFIEDYHCNEEMLWNEKVTVPGLYNTEGNELKYNAFCCEKIEQVKKVLKEYKRNTQKIYRLLFDYIIIEDKNQRKEIKIETEKVIKNIAELEKSEINEEIAVLAEEITNMQGELYNKGIYSIEREQAIKYTEEVIENTIAKFPEILQQDKKELWIKYNTIRYITSYEYEFENIEWELYEEVVDGAVSQK